MPQNVINRGSGSDQPSSTPLQTQLGRVAKTPDSLKSPKESVSDLCSTWKVGLMECRVAVVAVKAQVWPVKCVACTAVFNAAFQPRRYTGDEIKVSPFKWKAGQFIGAFSAKEKNVNHIVARRSSGAGFLCFTLTSPSHKVLLQNEIPLWTWPKLIELWNKISLVWTSVTQEKRKNMSKPQL